MGDCQASLPTKESKSTAHEYLSFGVYCVLRMFRWVVAL